MSTCWVPARAEHRGLAVSGHLILSSEMCFPTRLPLPLASLDFPALWVSGHPEHLSLSPTGTADANGLLSTPNVNGGGGGALGGAGGGGGAPGGVENGKPGADVVDLTLDSSSSSEEEEEEEEDEEDEDEEGPRPKRRCPFQKGLVSAC